MASREGWSQGKGWSLGEGSQVDAASAVTWIWAVSFQSLPHPTLSVASGKARERILVLGVVDFQLRKSWVLYWAKNMECPKISGRRSF